MGLYSKYVHILLYSKGWKTICCINVKARKTFMFLLLPYAGEAHKQQPRPAIDAKAVIILQHRKLKLKSNLW